MALRLFLPPLLLLTATLLITQAQGLGSSASDCCLKYSQTGIPTHLVTSYRLQGPESGCFLRAVVLTTKRNRKICASPLDVAVRNLMQRLNKKSKNENKAQNEKTAQNQRHKGKSKKQRRQQV